MKTTWRTPYLKLGKHVRVLASVGLRMALGPTLAKADYIPVYGLSLCLGPFTIHVEWKRKRCPFWGEYLTSSIYQLIDEIRHVELGEHNYFLNICCYAGYFHFMYVQNKDGKTPLRRVHHSDRNFITGLNKIKEVLKAEGYQPTGVKS